MVKDAEAHAAEDKTRRDVIDARNQADALAYSVEKTVNENRDRLPADDVSADRERDRGGCARRRRATTSTRFAARPTSCRRRRTRMAEQLYKQSQADQAAGAQGRSTEDDVKEGEVVDA